MVPNICWESTHAGFALKVVVAQPVKRFLPDAILQLQKSDKLRQNISM